MRQGEERYGERMTLTLLTAARGAGSLGDGLHYIAMAWLMSTPGLALSASALVVARAVPGAVFTPFAGGAADAFDRHRLLVGGFSLWQVYFADFLRPSPHKASLRQILQDVGVGLRYTVSDRLLPNLALLLLLPMITVSPIMAMEPVFVERVLRGGAGDFGTRRRPLRGHRRRGLPARRRGQPGQLLERAVADAWAHGLGIVRPGWLTVAGGGYDGQLRLRRGHFRQPRNLHHAVPALRGARGARPRVQHERVPCSQRLQSRAAAFVLAVAMGSDIGTPAGI